MIQAVDFSHHTQLIQAKKDQISILDARIAEAIQQNGVLENNNAQLQKSITLVNSEAQARITSQNATIANLKNQIAVAQEQRIARAQQALMPKPPDPIPVFPPFMESCQLFGFYQRLFNGYNCGTLFTDPAMIDLGIPGNNKTYLNNIPQFKLNIDHAIQLYKSGNMPCTHPDYWLVYGTYLNNNISRFGKSDSPNGDCKII